MFPNIICLTELTFDLPGYCIGEVISILKTPDFDICQRKCRDTEGCLWMTYDSSDSVCTLSKSCEFVDETCSTCVHGHPECGEDPSEDPVHILVLGGTGLAAREVEVLDIDGHEGANNSCPK